MDHLGRFIGYALTMGILYAVLNYKSKRGKAHGFNHGMRAPFSKI